MPRNRVRKTSIGLHTAEQMSNALKLISDGQKIKAVARSTGIPFSCSITSTTILDPTATASETLAKTKKRRVLQGSSSGNEGNISVYSEEESILEDEEDDYAVVDPDCMPALQSLPKEGDFIIVKFQLKGKGIYYITKVIGEMENETEVSFLRRSNTITNKFSVPIVPDIATVGFHDIKIKHKEKTVDVLL
ncbi:hypothetical protein WA026_010137 [Henosepilachna vigintioctopunctata]|uniref:HTH psq-type domain-containing protein n=1 Tax=Henosepilachna vigintioctopunctata TaxID=420089 RepID=A0AAW1UJG4_9CUCU